MAGVPNTFHFIWLGTSFPLFHRIAVESCIQNGNPDEVILWCDSNLNGQVHYDPLSRFPHFTTRIIDAGQLFEQVEHKTQGRIRAAQLGQVYEELTEPAGRANVLRLAILYGHGGIYLDSDTFTLRPFDALRLNNGFCGREHLIWPAGAKDKVNLYRFLGAPILGAIRNHCARVQAGHRLFEKVCGWYHQAVNNAVLGAELAHEMLEEGLLHIIETPKEERTVRYRFGTHLLQALTGNVSRSDFEVYDARCFYPLGPVISRQYFVRHKSAVSTLEQMIHSETVCIHWYASVTGLDQWSEERIAREAAHVPFAQLAARVLGHDVSQRVSSSTQTKPEQLLVFPNTTARAAGDCMPPIEDPVQTPENALGQSFDSRTGSM